MLCLNPPGKHLFMVTSQTSMFWGFTTKTKYHAPCSLGWGIQNWSRIWSRIPTAKVMTTSQFVTEGQSSCSRLFPFWKARIKAPPGGLCVKNLGVCIATARHHAVFYCFSCFTVLKVACVGYLGSRGDGVGSALTLSFPSEIEKCWYLKMDKKPSPSCLFVLGGSHPTVELWDSST